MKFFSHRYIKSFMNLLPKNDHNHTFYDFDTFYINLNFKRLWKKCILKIRYFLNSVRINYEELCIRLYHRVFLPKKRTNHEPFYEKNLKMFSNFHTSITSLKRAKIFCEIMLFLVPIRILDNNFKPLLIFEL